MVEKACRNCKVITELKECPICHSTKLSSRWNGLLIILEDDSELATEFGLSKGKYALKVK